ncbi:MAG TPA: hypothetical protein VJ867_15090 [Gemmatimonadaceae bacterium]|nr:hypothetical protein [Gemmatimonadaceae bacterium]
MLTSLVRLTLLAAPCAALLSRGAEAQVVNVPQTSAVIGVNVLIGGLTATTWALIRHRDPARAFAFGALGGATHFAGKYVASRRGTLSGWSGLLLSATGSSMVTNAGAGVAPLEDISIPIASLRVHLRPAAHGARVSVNAYETVMILHYATRQDLDIDWPRTLQTGTLVAHTDDDIVLDGDQAIDGVTYGPAIVVERVGREVPANVWKHEGTHVLQNYFEQDAWGIPIEDAVRKHLPMPMLRRIPDWIDIGIATYFIRAANIVLLGRYHGLDNLVEGEAYFMERR